MYVVSLSRFCSSVCPDIEVLNNFIGWHRHQASSISYFCPVVPINNNLYVCNLLSVRGLSLFLAAQRQNCSQETLAYNELVEAAVLPMRNESGVRMHSACAVAIELFPSWAELGPLPLVYGGCASCKGIS